MPNHSTEVRTDARATRVLRAAFLIGAVADAGALLPMLLPSLAVRLWGLQDVSGSYRVAMGCAASLMLGWTLLLVWAARQPLERRAVAALTFLVVGGLIVTEVVAAVSGILEARRLVPTWGLQAFLLMLFATTYHVSRPTPRVHPREFY